MNYSSRPPMRRPRPMQPCPVPVPIPAAECPAPQPAPCDCQLAISSIRFQTFGETYPPEVALCKGTVFPELDLPYCGGGPCCR